jgi:hypothetical protein
MDNSSLFWGCSLLILLMIVGYVAGSNNTKNNNNVNDRNKSILIFNLPLQSSLNTTLPELPSCGLDIRWLQGYRRGWEVNLSHMDSFLSNAGLTKIPLPSYKRTYCVKRINKKQHYVTHQTICDLFMGLPYRFRTELLNIGALHGMPKLSSGNTLHTLSNSIDDDLHNNIVPEGVAILAFTGSTSVIINESSTTLNPGDAIGYPGDVKAEVNPANGSECVILEIYSLWDKFVFILEKSGVLRKLKVAAVQDKSS